MGVGVGVFDQPYSIHCGPRLLGFSFHLSSLKGHRCREYRAGGVRSRRNSAFLF